MSSKSWEDLIKPAYVKCNSFLSGTEEEVRAEFSLWKKHWNVSDVETEKSTVPVSAIYAASMCPEEIFPNIFTLLIILATYQ